jgi:hypothetical protein
MQRFFCPPSTSTFLNDIRSTDMLVWTISSVVIGALMHMQKEEGRKVGGRGGWSGMSGWGKGKKKKKRRKEGENKQTNKQEPLAKTLATHTHTLTHTYTPTHTHTLTHTHVI